MKRFSKFVSVLIVAGMVLTHAAPASAVIRTGFRQELTPPMVDLVVTRPLGMVATALGVVAFLPVAALTSIVAPRDIGIPFKVLVWKPIEYTFVDRLGAH